jgi:hypothetical protein
MRPSWRALSAYADLGSETWARCAKPRPEGNILAGRLVERDHEIIRRACLITRSCFLDCSHELGSRENFVRVSGPVDV